MINGGANKRQRAANKQTFKKKKHKWNDLNGGSDLDKCIADDFPLLLRVGRHVQGLADAFPWRPVLLRDGEGCRPVVESVSCIHHCKEPHGNTEYIIKITGRSAAFVSRHQSTLTHKKQINSEKNATKTSKLLVLWFICY